MDNRKKQYGEEVPSEVYELTALLLCFVHELDERFATDTEGRKQDERN